MPTPYAGGMSIDMSDAPGGDMSLDDLFGNPELTATPSDAEPTPTPNPQGTETTLEEEFLKTPTGTVYKTKDEAIKGLSHKDELIERLRTKFKEETGRDPLDERQPRRAEPEVDVSDPVSFWNAQAKAIKDNDPVSYLKTLDSWLNARMGPYLPAVQQGAVAQARELIDSQIPGLREFRQSPDYAEALEAEPVLKEAIENAERNVQFAGQLPSLYRMAYRVDRGLKAERIARSGNPAPTPPTSARPTLSPANPTPPTPGVRPDLTTSAGRKALIDAAERRGVADADWGTMNF